MCVVSSRSVKTTTIIWTIVPHSRQTLLLENLQDWGKHWSVSAQVIAALNFINTRKETVEVVYSQVLKSGGGQVVKTTSCPPSVLCTTSDIIWTQSSEGLGEKLITSSSSFWVSSSIRLMSSMVKPTHLSTQQNSWRWKLVKIRFSCCGRRKKGELKQKEHPVGLERNTWQDMEGTRPPRLQSTYWEYLTWKIQTNRDKRRDVTLWMKFSTLVCRPHHLNLTVTSLYAHM